MWLVICEYIDNDKNSPVVGMIVRHPVTSGEFFEQTNKDVISWAYLLSLDRKLQTFAVDFPPEVTSKVHWPHQVVDFSRVRKLTVRPLWGVF